jgi:hypothetical protein
MSFGYFLADFPTANCKLDKGMNFLRLFEADGLSFV